VESFLGKTRAVVPTLSTNEIKESASRFWKKWRDYDNWSITERGALLAYESLPPT